MKFKQWLNDGAILTASQVASLVRKSPNLANNPILTTPKAWELFANRFGYGEDDGPFTVGYAEVEVLRNNIEAGLLRLSGMTSKNEIEVKEKSGELNPIIITHEQGRNMLVVDGNHSLLAAINLGKKIVKVIIDQKYKDLLISTG